jgi:dTDP-4-dehydrorhamnose 3,5-epimerase
MNKRFKFIATSLPDLYRVERKPIIDQRGFFNRFFCAEEFKQIGWNKPIVQMNFTLTRAKGAIRGMHFQLPPHAEAKLVTCLKGRVWDVAVDLRKNSSTFLQWHHILLTAEHQESFYIPEGFAHGFQTLTENCELLYLHSEAYSAEAEGALNALDPKLAISWPLDVSEMSDRDCKHSMLEPDFEGIVI